MMRQLSIPVGTQTTTFRDTSYAPPIRSRSASEKGLSLKRRSYSRGFGSSELVHPVGLGLALGLLDGGYTGDGILVVGFRVSKAQIRSYQVAGLYYLSEVRPMDSNY